MVALLDYLAWMIYTISSTPSCLVDCKHVKETGRAKGGRGGREREREKNSALKVKQAAKNKIVEAHKLKTLENLTTHINKLTREKSLEAHTL